MKWDAPELELCDHSRHVMADEPLVFHCNYYNYWLQKTLLLNDDLGMDQVIRDAAHSTAYGLLDEACQRRKLSDPVLRQGVAQAVFATLGLGTLDFSGTGPEGGVVLTPTSHYGQCFSLMVDSSFRRAQNWFDQGFAAAAVEVTWQLPQGTIQGALGQCMSQGASVGRIDLTRCERVLWRSPGIGPHGEGTPIPPNDRTHVDEASVLSALSSLDLSGNEEGLVPRFGVMLTHHLANFYNRISYEFLRTMEGSGLLEEAEELLINAGYRCAFHTFGGVMVSDEWYAVVAPHCKTEDDWIHGMVAVINAFGWGTWRVMELTADRIVMRIYDDYESTGYLAMYGEASRPICFLAMGGVAGLMSLVRIGEIWDRPAIDADYYRRVFESDRSFVPETTVCRAMGSPYTEIVATR